MSKRHYLHIFPTFCAAGPQVRAAALMRGMGAACRHTVVALDGRTEAAELAPDIELALLRFSPERGPASGVRFVRDLLRRENPDLLLSYNWGAMDAVIAARTMGWRRLVHHEDGFNSDEAQRLKSRRNWTRRLLLANVDIIVPSRGLLRIARETWGLRQPHFIANGIDARAFDRDPVLGNEFRQSLGIAADTIVIGTVGHLRPVKNYRRLIRAVAATQSQVHLVFVGDGAEREGLEALVSSLGITAHFTGHIHSLRAAYSAFDIFVMSSDSEQQPVALLEAMSSSLPVCSTDVGDVKATLPESQHDLIESLGPGVDDRLANALNRLSGNHRLRAELGTDNRRHVEQHYSEETMLGAYAQVYEQAQSGRLGSIEVDLKRAKDK